MAKQSNDENATPGVSREKASRTVEPDTATVDERARVRPWLSGLPLLSSSSPGKLGEATGAPAPRRQTTTGEAPARPRKTSTSRSLEAAAPRAIAPAAHALRAYQAPASPVQATPVALGQAAPATEAEEQGVNPLRVISRELVARGMAAPLVADLLAETVAEYGGQVLTNERAARLALVDILLSRIPRVSLLPSTPIPSREETLAPLLGTFLVTGPAGAGKSALIARLALWAARAGQRDVTLVNTQGGRIGAAAQATALGAVFEYPVEHLYSPVELRALLKRRRRDALRLVELPAWSPSQDPAELEGWLAVAGTVVICVPATGQGDDIHAALAAVRRAAPDTVAVLCKTSEMGNVVPALGALTALRQPVGLVAPGPNLADAAPAPDFAAIVTAAVCGAMQQDTRSGGGER